MFKSATVSLTLWYVLLVMTLSLLFSGVLYHFSTDELAEALHNQFKVLNDNDRDDRGYLSTYELDARSSQLFDNLIYFNIAVLVGSCLASYILARRTLRPIEAAHQAQIRFTADASHELRTPLTAMKADTEATLMRGSDDVVLLRRTLNDNLEDIKKLYKLTDHLVEVSRYDSKTVISKQNVDLKVIIEDVLKQLNRQIKDKKLIVKVESDPIQIYGDARGLHQLITIVLDNAVKYVKPKGKLSLILTQKNKQLVLIIKDNGIGIPASDLPHIFERFYRSKNVGISKRKTKGYGLGLPLAKEIVELHNGSIEVQSSELKGTTVTVVLPRF